MNEPTNSFVNDPTYEIAFYHIKKSIAAVVVLQPQTGLAPIPIL